MALCRVFQFSQELVHPFTSQRLITERMIVGVVTTKKTIKRYAYILHKDDKYTADEEKIHIEMLKRAYAETDDNKSYPLPNGWRNDTRAISESEFILKYQRVKQGEAKPKHYHVVAELSSPTKIESIARWFNVAPNFIDIPKGRGAFLDCVQYLTHEDEKQQKAGKHLYEDKDVKANFDFRKELDERAENRLKYGRDLSPKSKMFYDVLYNGMTISQCIDKDKLLYMENMDKIKKYRLEYISRQAPPKLRVNYYISGNGGIGKGLMARAIARSLFPDLKDDDEIFHSIGSENVGFEGYDGQPVIIWDDCRAGELLKMLGGRGNVFSVFDTHPTKKKQNIKYGSVNLINAVNIVNSVDDYLKFLNGLAGEYEDKSGAQYRAEDKAQSYRRFPMIIPIHESDFDLYINKGFMENTRDYEEYIRYNHIRGNMQRVAIACAENEKLAKQIQSNSVALIKEKHDEIVANHNIEVDEDAIMEEFKDYGKMIPQEEVSCNAFEEVQEEIPF